MEINKYQQGKKFVNIDGKYVDINSPEYRQLYNKGIGAKDKNGDWITSKSNLPEVTVTAPNKEGFWKQYANKLTKDNSGDLLSAITTPITAITNLPQAAATYITSGKVQNPSEALNIKNPIGSIATDVILDPINLLGLGVGTVSKPATVLNYSKGSSKVSEILSKLKNSPTVNKLHNLIAEAVDLPGRVTYNDKVANKELTEGNKFLQDWFSNPTTLDKISNLKAVDSDKDSWNTLQRNIRNDRYKTTFESDENRKNNLIQGRPPTFGIFVKGSSGYDLDLTQPTNIRQNLVNKYTSGIKSTAVHEGTHGITNSTMGMSNDFQSMMTNLINKDKVKSDYDEYLSEPDEVYARLMEIRNLGNFKPEETITMDRLKSTMNPKGKSNYPLPGRFLKLIKDKETLLKTLNTAPAIGVGIYSSNNE